jgi:hypothetical protein
LSVMRWSSWRKVCGNCFGWRIVGGNGTVCQAVMHPSAHIAVHNVHQPITRRTRRFDRMAGLKRRHGNVLKRVSRSNEPPRHGTEGALLRRRSFHGTRGLLL